MRSLEAEEYSSVEAEDESLGNDEALLDSEESAIAEEEVSAVDGSELRKDSDTASEFVLIDDSTDDETRSSEEVETNSEDSSSKEEDSEYEPSLLTSVLKSYEYTALLRSFLESAVVTTS